MKVLAHHIYEYLKGLRNLVLHTLNYSDLNNVQNKLNQRNISYFVQIVNDNKVNIFFGKEECVKIIKSFNKKSLKEFSDEEDFILGILLGYDRMQECQRYIKRKKRNIKSNLLEYQEY